MYFCMEVKAVLLGESGVGKSSIMERFINNEFHEDGQPTLGAAFQSKTIMIDEIPLKFQIWDTAGQEKYRAILPLYYRDAKISIIVYDVTNPQSFLCVQEWVTKLEEYTEQIKIIVGNKTDLDSQVSFDSVQQYAKSQGIEVYLTSCKTSDGINDIFYKVGQKVIVRPQKEQGQKLVLTKKQSRRSCC